MSWFTRLTRLFFQPDMPVLIPRMWVIVLLFLGETALWGSIAFRGIPFGAEVLVTRNSETLASFAAYCEGHPHERFWQALRNWAGVAFIFATNEPPPHGAVDTFYWERRTPDSPERRSRPRIPGRFKQAQDVAFEGVRKLERQRGAGGGFPTP